MVEKIVTERKLEPQKPTPAFIGVSWFALVLGLGGYFVGLWNANMLLNEKGYYFTLILFGLFAAISVQKSVRDKAEGIPVTPIYYGVSWFAVVASLSLLAIGLWNADLLLSEKGFYLMSFALALFGSVAVQKNVRDMAAFKEVEDVVKKKPYQNSNSNFSSEIQPPEQIQQPPRVD